jgi:site-specific DNA-methyltransferase (adenine-specific)
MQVNKVYQGNNIEVMKNFPDNSIDSIVTDPPYGINFMNKKWDYDVPSVELWKEVLRVLKPGGHALVACGTRTQHRMAVNLEDAGFEIRDIVAWVYGNGFPKSLDISKSIDKMMGAEREVVEQTRIKKDDGTIYALRHNGNLTSNTPLTDEAKQWQGWGTTLKPAMELWTLCRKPIQGTVANNVLKYGVGGLNIDGCRVGLSSDDDTKRVSSGHKTSYIGGSLEKNYDIENQSNRDLGRFPANFIHDGSDEVLELFPNIDEESPARFFYTAKASQSERNFGLGGFENVETGILQGGRKEGSAGSIMKDEKGERLNPYAGDGAVKKNIHPTVKPIDLMRYLVRMITPKGGVCLDPFLGSGTTAVACKAEKFNYIGIELDPEYVKIAEARISAEVIKYDIFDFMEDGETP